MTTGFLFYLHIQVYGVWGFLRFVRISPWQGFKSVKIMSNACWVEKKWTTFGPLA